MKTILLLITSLLTAAAASAVTILDRSPDAFPAAPLYFGSSSISTTQVFADSFTLTDNYEVTGLDLFAQAGYPYLGQKAFIQFWKGTAPSGSPTLSFTEDVASVDSLFTSSRPQIRRVEFNFTTPLVLLSSTQYWVSVSGFSDELAMAGLYGIDDGKALIEYNQSFETNFDLSFMLYGNKLTGQVVETSFGAGRDSMLRYAPKPPKQVPDSGSTVALAAIGLGALALIRRRS